MPYTLITPSGKIYTFYYEITAKCYAQAYGGEIVTKDILNVTSKILETT